DVSGDARRFARKLGITYPLVHAPTTIWDDWGVTGVPETFFVDRRGRLVDVHVAGPVFDGTNRGKYERGLRLALRPVRGSWWRPWPPLRSARPCSRATPTRR